MSRYASHLSARSTPPSEPIPGSNQVPNSGGGYAYPVDDWTRLDRFIVLGAEGGTYYAWERKLAVENAGCVRACLALDARRTIARIVEVSESGRAPKNGPAVMALALAAAEKHVAILAELDALNKVCRIPTDLFGFMAVATGLRGMGRAMKSIVDAWYRSKTPEKLAFLVSKYRQRDGWSHRDVLRLAHVRASAAHDPVLRWAVAGAAALGDRSVTRKATGATTAYPGVGALPDLLVGVEAIQDKALADVSKVVNLIRSYGLAREHVPTNWLNSKEVWEALLEKMPLHAMVRSLGKMSAIGLLSPLSAAARVAADRLGDADYIRKSRLHPMAILLASATYGAGKGLKGSLAWSPVPRVVDALDAAFYSAFGNVVPTGKRRLLALDVSGSMDGSNAAGSSLSCRAAAAAMAMVVARTEPQYHILAFSNGLIPLDISGCSRLADVVRVTNSLSFSSTDCSLPMELALATRMTVDSFEIYTDSETNTGRRHPSQALAAYRKEMAIPAKMVVQAFTATPFSIADPQDSGMLDVAGLDAASPSIVADFLRDAPARVENRGMPTEDVVDDEAEG